MHYSIEVQKWQTKPKLSEAHWRYRWAPTDTQSFDQEVQGHFQALGNRWDEIRFNFYFLARAKKSRKERERAQTMVREGENFPQRPFASLNQVCAAVEDVWDQREISKLHSSHCYCHYCSCCPLWFCRGFTLKGLGYISVGYLGQWFFTTLKT